MPCNKHYPRVTGLLAMHEHSSSRGSVGAALAALLLTSLLAGCADGPAPATDDLLSTGGDALPGDDRDLRTDLTSEDRLAAPDWRVGDWWGIQIAFGSQGGDGARINSIVTDANNGYFLATDDPQVAKAHALRDLPLLGAMTRDLSATAYGGTWDWFQFPLSDGAAWTGEIPNIAFDILPDGQVPVRFTATFSDAVDVAGETYPGYDVEGVTEDGTPIIRYAYAPTVGWIASATVYDIDPGQDPVEFTLTLAEYGRNWTGTYYVDEANVVLENLDGSGLTDPPPEGQPFAAVSPHATFTVSEDAMYLYGIVVNAAVAGARATVLHTPTGEVRHYEAVGAPGDESVVRIDEPALPGQWRLATTGAGAFTFSDVLLAEITETTGTL